MRLEYMRSSASVNSPAAPAAGSLARVYSRAYRVARPTGRPDPPSGRPGRILRETVEMRAISREIGDLVAAHERLLEFFAWFGPRATQEGIADFVAGNPQEMRLPAYLQALKRWTEPRSKDHFAYHLNVPEAQRAVAAGLAERRGVRFATEDIILTN